MIAHIMICTMKWYNTLLIDSSYTHLFKSSSVKGKINVTPWWYRSNVEYRRTPEISAVLSIESNWKHYSHIRLWSYLALGTKIFMACCYCWLGNVKQNYHWPRSVKDGHPPSSPVIRLLIQHISWYTSKSHWNKAVAINSEC